MPEPVTLISAVQDHSAANVRSILGAEGLQVRHIAWSRSATSFHLNRQQLALALDNKVNLGT